MPPDIFGHLLHGLRLHRPKELRMVLRQMPLGRFEQLLLGSSCELRPALAKSDPTVLLTPSGPVVAVI